ncbi:uncharacterized protein LOC101862268 [Aplysia californica]|uniref:Uncharacterized protein LOC101862268 n=1 Tax=Aplysia californica TaxID=6500 RepID=A0ABM0JNW2_APLCA|nr:uncharacterized protein LOC101862268 [Aplysia californica]
MDFNPLDILAAAALGEKDASSDIKCTSGGQEGPSGSNNTSEESEESKDAEDDTETEMGKTTSNGLKPSKGVKEAEKTMAPQKSPWSPDAFLSPNLGSSNVISDKFSIGDLVQDLKKSPECEKLLHTSILSDPLGGPLENSKEFEDSHYNGINNNVISVKNVTNKLASDVLSGASTPKSPSLGSPPSVKSVDNDCPLREPEVPTDNSEQGSPSDTDTADSDSKSLELTDVTASESVGLDHPYALVPGQPGPSSMMDPFEEDYDVDVCSQSSPLTEETEQRSRNLSLDCNYLKSGILEGVSASTLDLYRMSSCALGRSKLPSSSSSTSSPTHDASSKPALLNLHKDDSGDTPSRAATPVIDSGAPSPDKRSPKYGKFRIGTFASFSSSNLELEKYLRNKDHVNGKKLNIGIPPDTSLINSSLSSPTTYPSLHPLLQSPSLDWDRSEAGSEAHDDSSDARTPHRLSPDFTVEKVTEWSHPMYHDHDYCAKDSDSKPSVDEASISSSAKRKYTKRKSKLDSVVNHEKIMKAKYLKKELLKQDTFKKTAPSEVEFMPVEAQSVKANPVGRPKKRPFEKTIEEEIDPETGAKMKITGKFQDQYVYYLSKSSRTTSRRRQAPALPFPSDRIIVPAPKPGDIIVPHLTDDDVEAVRLRGRDALNPPERPPISSSNIVSPVVPSTTSSELISDVDSHIVSTILSMESDIGSPSTSQPSDMSTSDLNPNQPALTESLRLMSGDNSITSEHVLNYLLSVVKDEVPEDNLLSSTTGFDTSSSALFSPLSSDSIYSKVDHLEPQDVHRSEIPSGSALSNACGDMLKDDCRALQTPITSSSSIHSSHSQEPVHFAHSLSKDQEEDNVQLPDDLSSFMSNSQGTASSSTTQDGDSHGSLKSMFGSDLSSLGTPQLSSSVPRLTSIEKTLDFLGVKDDEIRLDNTEVFSSSSKLHSDISSSQLLASDANCSGDDTPWIVTVTLYFNDVPAIMINNQPFIRLVDIHKQILPAKDTGILKKRCQLLKIPVLNCSEMQRYFLVQYGRAYNSKSTLIISKDQATELVTYYATPQPRVGRGEDAHQVRSQSRGSDSGGTMSPVTVIGSVTCKKKSHNRGGRKSSSAAQGVLVSDATDVPTVDVAGKHGPAEPATGNGLHSKRTRHKKINYLEMLRGEEKEKTSEDAIMETIESVVKSSPGYYDLQKSKKKCISSTSSGNVPTKKKLKSSAHCDKKVKKTKPGKVSKFCLKKIGQGPKVSKEKLEHTIEKVKSSKIKMSKNDRPTDKSCDTTTTPPTDLDSDDNDSAQAKSKFRPLKLKVNSLLNFAGNKKSPSPTKKGLFSRSNSSSSSTSDRPLRVLAVAHQPALLNEKEESHLPSQPADIHLDLFTRSSSPCVRCQTCSQFLSVPDFMRHHHVAMDNEWLATEAAHRILVPRNKENISEQEKKLWEEFHRLQEAIGGFGGDDESDSDENDDYGDEDQCSLNVSGTSSSLLGIDGSPPTSPGPADRPQILQHMEDVLSSDGEEEDEVDASSHPISSLTLPSFDQRAQKLKLEMASKIGLVKRDQSKDNGSSNVSSLIGIKNGTALSSLRTSSRKRKSKQLFSIENYYMPRKIANGDELQSGNSLQNGSIDGGGSFETQFTG